MAEAGVPCEKFAQDLTPPSRASDAGSCNPATGAQFPFVAVWPSEGVTAEMVEEYRANGAEYGYGVVTAGRWTLTVAAAQCSDVAEALDATCVR